MKSARGCSASRGARAREGDEPYALPPPTGERAACTSAARALAVSVWQQMRGPLGPESVTPPAPRGTAGGSPHPGVSGGACARAEPPARGTSARRPRCAGEEQSTKQLSKILKRSLVSVSTRAQRGRAGERSALCGARAGSGAHGYLLSEMVRQAAALPCPHSCMGPKRLPRVRSALSATIDTRLSPRWPPRAVPSRVCRTARAHLAPRPLATVRRADTCGALSHASLPPSGRLHARACSLRPRDAGARR